MNYPFNAIRGIAGRLGYISAPSFEQNLDSCRFIGPFKRIALIPIITFNNKPSKIK